MNQFEQEDPLLVRINLETAQIGWHELQRFFASGHVIAVDTALDLTQVAACIAANNAEQIKIWMDSAQVDVVTDEQAKIWFEQNAIVWAVAVKPWVLVQPVNA